MKANCTQKYIIPRPPTISFTHNKQQNMTIIWQENYAWEVQQYWMEIIMNNRPSHPDIIKSSPGVKQKKHSAIGMWVAAANCPVRLININPSLWFFYSVSNISIFHLSFFFLAHCWQHYNFYTSTSLQQIDFWTPISLWTRHWVITPSMIASTQQTFPPTTSRPYGK